MSVENEGGHTYIVAMVSSTGRAIKRKARLTDRRTAQEKLARLSKRAWDTYEEHQGASRSYRRRDR
jgi:hypothetical protein